MWKRNGIEGWGEQAPPLCDNFSGVLVIMGGARGIWDDLREIEASIIDRDHCQHMAVNDIGQYWHHELTHWVTLHGNYMRGWREFRMGHGYGNGGHVFTHSFAAPNSRQWPEIDHWWGISFGGGTSGMFGCYIGLALGYKKLILAGIPMDGTGHFFDPPWVKTTELTQDAEKIVWTGAANGLFRDRVKSMSGNTAKWLGTPTKEWINAGNG